MREALAGAVTTLIIQYTHREISTSEIEKLGIAVGFDFEIKFIAT